MAGRPDRRPAPPHHHPARTPRPDSPAPPSRLPTAPTRGYSAWAFHKGLREAYLFRRAHQHLAVPATYRGNDQGDPLHLRRWLSERRRNVTRLTTQQINALQALDMRWR
ncbi:helicase associated domain-containing protein [Streptomyces halobius]|uniref:Helicase associated domain protein n=1 Tax=Streptomyces halobius TaxID=2879846 RepID=A0ABY4MJP6_9ACTN|nr:Helicase associated domain protein [Streptomyces halobius]